MNLSIIIATYKRAASLDGVLASIARSSYPLERVQVIVADNAGDDVTRRTCEAYAEALELVYVVETAPGKNAALNTALPYATGELLLFTDDDIEAPPDWIPETQAAAARWPHHAVFGGKVLPIWPVACPPHLNDPRYLGMCFSVLDMDAAEGPSPHFTPFGPNVAIRRTVFDAGLRFDPRVGPRGMSYIMGSETELLRRLQRLGHAPVYVPRSIVGHKIRADQLTNRWLHGRAFRYGRLVEIRRQEAEGDGTRTRPVLRLVPKLCGSVARAAAAGVARGRAARFEHGMRLAMELGMMYQSLKPPLMRHAPPLAPTSDARRSALGT